MFSKKNQRFEIHQIELRDPLVPITVPADASGLAFVFRADDRPVGFFMEELAPGTVREREQIADRALQCAGQQILAERIYAELRGAWNHSDFPSLDIAICTHGRPETLARCLRNLDALGLIGKTQNVRVMVIDNAPRDERTRDVVREFPRVIYVKEPKPGLDFARNRAIADSTAEFLAFLDDDVVVDRSWLPGLQDAWAENPDGAGFAGPILPYELETRAQIVFEKMGGFGKSFERVRFASELPDSPVYPCGAGIFGAGANMVFRRSVLEHLGGFDEALDTGAPLPGGGDLDMFYRVVRAGFPFIREPHMVVYHQHRREYRQLRHQMWTWGLGTMAYLVKSWRTDVEERPRIRKWFVWWHSYQLSKLFVPFLRRNRTRWPWDMVAAELIGAFVGLCGEYDRSRARIAKLRRQFA